MKLSDRFKSAVKLSKERQYRLALSVGYDPSSFSLILNDGRKPRLNDPRLIKIALKLGLGPGEIFEEDLG